MRNRVAHSALSPSGLLDLYHLSTRLEKRMRAMIVLTCLAATSCMAEDFAFPGAAAQDGGAVAEAIPALAGQLIEAWRDPDRAKYLDTLFRLQIAARRYAGANETLDQLRVLHASDLDPQPRATYIPYEMFVRASLQQTGASSFPQSFERTFRDTLQRLDDRSSALAIRALTAIPAWEGVIGPRLRDALHREEGKSTISLNEGVALARAYALNETYRSFSAAVPALVDEDDRRRYIIDKDVLIKTADGAQVCALIVRPRSLATARLPTLLNFTIYVDARANMQEARRTASNGYVAVEGFARGKACSPGLPVPFEDDGTDAAALIDWITAQSWGDGRVGMYGGSYEGFAQWAAAKHRPEGLKALMPSVTAAPGLDIPLDGGIFQNFFYPWPLYTTTNKDLDAGRYFDKARWDRLKREWYVSGRAYRDLDKIDGTPNPFWHRWLSHPVYDRYWQRQIPFEKEFARIDIPVLTTTGYFDGGQIGALYYFTEHYKYRPNAQHYLLIGPYDHFTGQRGTRNGLGETLATIEGYSLDPVAWIDIGKLRYEWFDHIFKGAPRPALLQDKINYQVLGANVWKHAPSIAAMGTQSLKLYLRSARSGADGYELGNAPAPNAFIRQTVDFKDRGDVDRVAPGGNVFDQRIDTANGLKFVSDPFAAPAQLSGLFSARFNIEINKRDFDFNVQLYELTPANEYVRLSYYWSRASYVRDRSRRTLLKPGVRQQLNVTARRLISRQFQAGSRLVVVLTVNKNAEMQINYGTGRDVSDETIADAEVPLEIKWFGDSSLSMPMVPGR